MPADVLAQRPDVFSAGRDVAAASAEVGSAQAARYPRLALSGSIGAAQARALGTTVTLDTWSIGPLSLSLPLFDGGRRAANVEAAQARYDEAAALYRAKVRQAVREVEEALVNLQSSRARARATRKRRWTATAPPSPAPRRCTRTAWPACPNWKTPAARC